MKMIQGMHLVLLWNTNRKSSTICWIVSLL